MVNQLQVQRAQAAQRFLSRTDLKGGEVPMFVDVMDWLDFLQQPEPTPEAPAAGDETAEDHDSPEAIERRGPGSAQPPAAKAPAKAPAKRAVKAASPTPTPEEPAAV